MNEAGHARTNMQGAQAMNTTTRNEIYGADTAAWWVIGLWIRLALTGAMAAFGGVAMLAEQATLDLTALGLIVVGAAVAAGAKHMAQRAIDRLDAPPGAAAALGASELQPPPEIRVQRRVRRAWAVSP
jgi:hypothetical protein